MTFENRWMIAGRLTTNAPLHIGNGDFITKDSMVAEKRDEAGKVIKEKVEITAIGTDRNGHPYIPGSTLKGNLRALADRLKLATVEELFGSPDPEVKTSVGGKAEFYDARAIDAAPVFTHSPPHWDAKRQTGVTASVTLDRPTKTASEQRLFHEEFVPPGVSFDVTISGQNYSDAELTDLLWLLNSFNSGAAKLGAGTGSGNGLMRWELTDLKRMTKEDVAKWLTSGAATTGYAALASIPLAERQALATKAANIRSIATQPDAVTLNIRLDFQSNFLVNDPSRTGTIEEKKAGHTPLLNVDGKPLLPASSMRGAFRAQAEKIVRTIGNEKCACYLNNNGEREACRVDEMNEKLTEKLKPLCPTCLLFGSTSWKAVIDFSDFVATDSIREEKLFQQEFVAIDRFTGGGAEQKKFNARSVDRPTLRGTISVDLSRLNHFAKNGWPLGLLALVLRDFIEGDVRLGLGAAKGYGTVRLTTENINLPEWDACPAAFKKGFTPQQWSSLSAANAPDPQTPLVLMQWVADLSARIQEERGNQ